MKTFKQFLNEATLGGQKYKNKKNPNDNTHKLHLDFSGDDGKRWIKTAKKHGVEAKLVDPHGPGGGNPVYSVKGKHSALKKFLHKHYNGGDSSMGWRDTGAMETGSRIRK